MPNSTPEVAKDLIDLDDIEALLETAYQSHKPDTVQDAIRRKPVPEPIPGQPGALPQQV